MEKQKEKPTRSIDIRLVLCTVDHYFSIEMCLARTIIYIERRARWLCVIGRMVGWGEEIENQSDIMSMQHEYLSASSTFELCILKDLTLEYDRVWIIWYRKLRPNHLNHRTLVSPIGWFMGFSRSISGNHSIIESSKYGRAKSIWPS